MRKGKLFCALLALLLILHGSVAGLTSLAEDVVPSESGAAPFPAAEENPLLAETAPAEGNIDEQTGVVIGDGEGGATDGGDQILNLTGEADSTTTPEDTGLINADEASPAEGENPTPDDTHPTAGENAGDETPAADDTPGDGMPADAEGSDGDTPGDGDPSLEEEPPVPPEMTGLSVVATAMTIGVGERVSLDARALPEGALCTLKYSTSNKKYVAVSADGYITGKKRGKATVAVKSNKGFVQKIRITVLDAPKKVTLKLGRLTLGVGETTTMTSSIPKKTASWTRVYSVDDSGVLSITEGGLLKAEQPGRATVTVRTFKKRASLTVTVLPAPEHLNPNPASMALGVGVSGSFNAALPSGTMGTIHYESLDPDIVSVDAKTGRVTGLALGAGRVRGVAHNGAWGECRVDVLPAPEQIELTETELTLLVGQSWAPEARIEPENAYGALTLSSSNAKIVKVQGDSVVAVAKGTATVTAKTYNGLIAKATIRVPAAPTGISLSQGVLNLASGDTVQLRYSLLGGGQTIVRFSSSNDAVASVDSETGEITAIGPGTVIVTAATINGKQAKCLVNVDLDADEAGLVDGEFQITFMEIGRNDGILIQCGGEYAFIDSGMHRYGVKAVNYMRSRGVKRLKYYIGTHSHLDHVAGAGAILAAFPTDCVLVPHKGVISTIKNYAEGKAEKAAAKAANYHIMKLDETVYLGRAKLKCLGPVKIRPASCRSGAENVNSLILRVTYGRNTFLLTGDATGPEIKEIQKKRPGSLRAQVFKNPHHNGTQTYAAKLCNPEITVFSTSKKAQPAAKYLKWLKQRGSRIFITSHNRNSHVTIYSDGTDLFVSTAR